jgi:streptogramin lyase
MLATLKPSLSTVAYRLAYAVLALISALSLALVAGARAQAAPVVDGEFGLTSDAHRLAAGPDGSMWATLTDPAGSVARIAPNGAVTYPNVPTLNAATAITAGPAGRMWVTLPNDVGSFDPADPEGTATTFPAIGVGGGNSSLTVGPDGNLWAANGDQVFRIAPGGTVDPFTVTGGSARGIVSSGGLLWVADFGTQAIVSVTTTGTTTSYPIGGGPQGIAAGPDGQVGFTNPTPPHRVGRLVAGGSPLQTETAPTADPFGMTYGSDGAYWFAQPVTNNLGRLTADGEYSQLGGLSPDSNPRYVAAGPSNTIWVALHESGGVGGKKVARVSGLEPPVAPGAPGSPGSTVAPGNVPPILSKLAVTPKRFRVAKAPTAVSAAKRGKGRRRSAPAGTTVAFTLNEAATVRLTIERKLAGRRRGGKCVKPTRALRSAKRCARYVKRGTLSRRILAGGANSFRFSGRIGRRALAAGSYRITAVATDAGGLRSTPRRAKFRVVAAR